MHHIHPFLIAQLFALLALANGAPLIAKWLLGSALAFPLDNGITLKTVSPDRLWAHNGLTTMRSSTLMTPGASQATRSASSRSTQERTFPLSITSPPCASTVI
jgi:hypothetical protein